MPYRGFKVIVVVPAGRRIYLELQMPQIINYMTSGLVDEYHLWKNTVNQEDINWLYSKQSNTIKVIEPDTPYNGNLSIGDFYKYCKEDDTIYIRICDDVILLDNVNAFRQYIDFRIDNPDYFIIYPVILNNSIITSILQEYGKLSENYGKAERDCFGIAWKDTAFACNLHDEILHKLKTNKNNLNCFYIPNTEISDGSRVSVNCISWLGRNFNGIIIGDEEAEMSCSIPKKQDLINCIYGNCVVLHYSYYTQREELDKKYYLEKYKYLLI
jgi:hypothetical protein